MIKKEKQKILEIFFNLKISDIDIYTYNLREKSITFTLIIILMMTIYNILFILASGREIISYTNIAGNVTNSQLPIGYVIGNTYHYSRTSIYF